MKRNLMDLLKLIATRKMRPALESDNPWFFGDNVYAIDLGDELLMFGSDDDGTHIYYQTMDGSQEYHVSFDLVLDDMEG
jgi:hypothetical protein